MKQNLQKIAPFLLTGLLLSAAWPDWGFEPLMFVALVPMIYGTIQISKSDSKRKGTQIFLFSYLGFALFNLLATYWIQYAHWTGLAAVCVFNASLMALVFWGAHRVSIRLGWQKTLLTLPFFWLTFEAFHQDWDMSWTWLTFGFSFAKHPEWVQWYEWLGAPGGTLWVWITNLLMYKIFTNHILTKNYTQAAKAFAFVIVVIIGLPIVLSYLRYHTYQESTDKIEVVVVQPNFDAYDEKFDLPQSIQVERFIGLALDKATRNTRLFVGPETMLPENIEEANLQYHPDIRMLYTFKKNFPSADILLGASTYKTFMNINEVPVTARKYDNHDAWYDLYNAALYFKEEPQPFPYHKSRLVVGVEHFPFSTVLKPLLSKAVGDFGGTTGTHGVQEERTVFTHSSGDFATSPVICFESVFGGFVGEFVRNGADFLCIITNDDWWDNTAAHLQHLHYARLRAVENRRSVARSANTGISAFINERGDILQSLPYREAGALRGEVTINKRLTFYSKSGDVIFRMAVFITLFMVLYAIAFRLRGKKIER